MTVAEWTHDALAKDLAAHLRGSSKPMMTWTDMQLGPVGSPRPDVYCIAPSYSNFHALAFEVKVSREDFLGDVTSGKALGYLKFAHALVFAAPAGMVKKTEVPTGCGLIERHAEVWRFAKRPTHHPLATLPHNVWMKLVIDGIGRVHSPGGSLRRKQFTTWAQEDHARRLLGEELALLLADRNGAARRLENAKKQLDQETDDWNRRRQLRAEESLAQVQAAHKSIQDEINRVAKDLGLDSGRASAWAIRKALAELRPENDRIELRQAAQAMRRDGNEMIRRAAELESRLGSQTAEPGA